MSHAATAVCLLFASAAAPTPVPTDPGSARAALQLTESVPVETSLDDPSIRDTPEVWLEMLAGADSLVELETFYISPDPAGVRFSEVLEELGRASRRGVCIRVLVDAGFARTYPGMVDTIDSWPGAEVRLLDAKELWGGVLHAKCMVVDRDDLFLGSQNWDWRSLEHVRELGIRVRHIETIEAIRAVMTMDWALGRPRSAEADAHTGFSPGAREGDDTPPPVRSGPFAVALAEGSPTAVRVAGSPPGALPRGVPWDEPLLVELIDSAQRSLCAQVLTFDPVGSRTYHEALECALKRAAARGVRVRIIVSNWSTRPATLPYVRSLAATPGIEVRFSNLPQWSGGFIPYARVEHPKYAVADEARCWIGTSNWTRGGFHDSRNLSLFIEGGTVPATVARYFQRGWESPYVETADGCTAYRPPRIAE